MKDGVNKEPYCYKILVLTLCFHSMLGIHVDIQKDEWMNKNITVLLANRF